jgi:pimeloyl-ACP methyl ester carboxylesterase
VGFFATAPEVETDGVPGPPGLPLGRRVELPGRGTTFVRELAGPPGAPTVLLLHGWLASGGLNWYQVMGPLSHHFRVLAPDLRGHGRGIRSSKRFTLADCADDCAALLDALGVDSVIAVGYSMGGPVAQLLWKRHPERVDGLVMCATSLHVVPVLYQRLVFTTVMATLANTTRLSQIVTRLPRRLVRGIVPTRTSSRPETLERWAGAEMRRHSTRMLMEAGHTVGNYSARRWIHEVDVPTVCLITTLDKALSPLLQADMALRIPEAEIRRVEDGHLACASPDFAPALIDACRSVARRARSSRLTAVS